MRPHAWVWVPIRRGLQGLPEIMEVVVNSTSPTDPVVPSQVRYLDPPNLHNSVSVVTFEGTTGSRGVMISCRARSNAIYRPIQTKEHGPMPVGHNRITAHNEEHTYIVAFRECLLRLYFVEGLGLATGQRPREPVTRPLTKWPALYNLRRCLEASGKDPSSAQYMAPSLSLAWRLILQSWTACPLGKRCSSTN